MIYQDDAVAFAYRAMMEESPKYPLYHITSGEAITQMDLAELIRQNADGVEIRDDTVGEGFRLVLDGSRYQEEFDGRIFVPYEKGVKAVVTYMQNTAAHFCSVMMRGRVGETGYGVCCAGFSVCWFRTSKI